MKYVLLYPSIHDVLCAERALLAARTWHDLVPVPAELSSDCGMAVELGAAGLDEALALLTRSCRPWTGCFTSNGAGRYAPLPRSTTDRARNQ